jgi:hypothetical protein
VARWLAIMVIVVVALAGAGLCLGVSEISYPSFYCVQCSAPDKLDYVQEMEHPRNAR